MKPGWMLSTAVLPLALGCHTVQSGVEPEPLGYGPGSQASLASGYDPDPVPRPAPTPWTPPEREQRAPLSLGELMEAATDKPIDHAKDVVAVCEHLASLAEGEARNEQPACLRRYRIARVFRTIGDWKTLAACILASSDRRSVVACEQATPRAFGGVAEYPRESEVCMYVFALTLLEQLGPEPMLERQDLLEFEPMLHDCVESFVTEERGDRNPKEYVELLECIEGARTTAAVEACG